MSFDQLQINQLKLKADEERGYSIYRGSYKYNNIKMYKRLIKKYFSRKGHKTVAGLNRAVKCNLRKDVNSVYEPIAMYAYETILRLEEIASNRLLDSEDKTREKFILNREHPVPIVAQATDDNGNKTNILEIKVIGS